MNNYLSPDYLFAIASETQYQSWYLYVALAIIVLAVTLKIIFIVKKNREAYKSFDRLWFWGFLIIGFLGLFVWFSRDQGLPIFGTRAVSYTWILTVLGHLCYLLYYYKRKVTREVVKHYEKSRKDKYLK